MFKILKRQKINHKVKIEKDEEQLDMDQISNLLEKKTIPLMVIDPLWYELKKIIVNDNIETKEKLLNELVKEKGKLTTESLEYEKVKQSLLYKILQLSEELQLHSQEHIIKEIEITRQSVLKTNEILKKNENRLEELEILIDNINGELVKEAVQITYKEMNKKRAQKEEIEKAIDELRKEVVNKTEKKKQYDRQFGILYNYLHKIMGYKQVEQLDQELGEK